MIWLFVVVSKYKKVVAIIQARMSSTRLPGKVLFYLNDKTVLEHVVQRVKFCQTIDEIVVATTDLPIDDQIIEECNKIKVSTFRGSSEDVLSRYYHTAKEYKADIIIRITADCPLICPYLLQDMIEKFLKVQPDYLSNTIVRTYPKGLDIEIFSFEALEKAYNDAIEGYDREHVTPYFYQTFGLFSIYSFQEPNHSHYSVTLDTKLDWYLIQKIFNQIGKSAIIIHRQNLINILVSRHAKFYRRYLAIGEKLRLFNSEVAADIYVFNNKDYSVVDLETLPVIDLSIEKITTEDLMSSIYYWRNHELNRKYSHNTDIIDFDTHIKWFRQILKRENVDLLICKNDGCNLGVIRFDSDEENSTVSIYLLPGWHGKGLGKEVLKKAIDWLKEKRPKQRMILAEILSENIASIKTFERCEFKKNFLGIYYLDV